VNRRAVGLLALGTFFIFVTFMRYSLPVVGWIAFAPLLVLVFTDGAPRSHVALLAILSSPSS
jgi:hypothetical protein